MCSEMMSKTHLAVGLASSLLVFQPTSFGECVIAIIGGSVGGVLADNDILDNDYQSDALIGQVMAFGITGICVFLDYIFKLGMCQMIYKQPTLPIIGGIGFFVLYIVGFCSEHRKFTHSFLAMILYGIATSLIYESFAIPFTTAYFSHLLLDICNKKKVFLFYPLKKGICLNICYANKSANNVLMYVGFSITGILLIISLISIFT